MIPAFLVTRYGPEVAAGIMKVIAAVVAVLLLIGLYYSVKSYFTAGLEVQLKVNAAQGNAMSESGHDAVQTTATVADNSAASDQVTRENDDAITKSKGASNAIDPALRAAGLQSLCRRPSYRNAHPSCVQ